jgi:hypothetical protein
VEEKLAGLLVARRKTDAPTFPDPPCLSSSALVEQQAANREAAVMKTRTGRKGNGLILPCSQSRFHGTGNQSGEGSFANGTASADIFVDRDAEDVQGSPVF